MVRMDHRHQYHTPKSAKRNRKRFPQVIHPSSIIVVFLFLVCHLVTTTSIVYATVVADSEKNGDIAVKQDKESEVREGVKDQYELITSDIEEIKEEIGVNKILEETKEDVSSIGEVSNLPLDTEKDDMAEEAEIRTTEELNSIQETNEDESNDSSDPPSNDNELDKEIGNPEDSNITEEADRGGDENKIYEVTEERNDDIKVENIIEKSSIESEVKEKEGGEVGADNAMVESDDELFPEREEILLSSSENESKDEGVQNDSVVGKIDSMEEGGEDEIEISPNDSSPSVENVADEKDEAEKVQVIAEEDIKNHEISIDEDDDDEEKDHMASDSSSEKTTKMKPDRIEMEEDMDGGINSIQVEDNNQKSNETSASSTKSNQEEEISRNAMMENELPKPPTQSQNQTQEIENEEQAETSTNDVSSSDGDDSFMSNDTHIQDKNSSFISETTEEFPIYDDKIENDDLVIDLDVDVGRSEEKKSEEIGDEQEEVEKDGAQSATMNIHYEKSSVSGSKKEGPEAKDHSSIEIGNNDGVRYCGEPWGQYRSIRRIPDLELLRLVFENANKTSRKRARGDIKSHDVVDQWQKDPLYDGNMTMDGPSQTPLLLDEDDQNFLDYRSRLLGEDVGVTSDSFDSKSTKGIENMKTEVNVKNNNENNENSNNADVNSEFVEGIDDIANFFEGVDPPDELDVGYGSSIQDVLIDKGKHILLKKIRGVARWMQLGWKTMGLKVKERISEFQLPFQRIGGTKSTTSGVGAATSESNSVASSNQHEQTLARIREAIVSAYKTGKRVFEKTSDLVDGLLDRFDGRTEDDSADYEDFSGFNLDNLSTFPKAA